MKAKSHRNANAFDSLIEKRQKVPHKLWTRFQFHMAIAMLALLIASVIGCELTNIRVRVAGDDSSLFVSFLMLTLIGMYWKDEHHSSGVMSILVIPWVLLLIPLMIFPMLIAAHLALPLQDTRLAGIDSVCGISVPAIAIWAAHHSVGRIINRSYALLAPFIVIAVLLPVIAGRLIEVRKFLISILIAIISIVCSRLATGKFYGVRITVLSSPNALTHQEEIAH